MFVVAAVPLVAVLLVLVLLLSGFAALLKEVLLLLVLVLLLSGFAALLKEVLMLLVLVLLLSGFAAAASGQLLLLLLQRMSPGQTEPMLASADWTNRIKRAPSKPTGIVDKSTLILVSNMV